MRALLAVAVFLSLGFQDVAVTLESTVRGAADIFAEQFYDAEVGATVAAELRRRLPAAVMLLSPNRRQGDQEHSEPQVTRTNEADTAPAPYLITSCVAFV